MRDGWCSWQTFVVSMWFWIHWSCPFCVDLAQARQAIFAVPGQERGALRPAMLSAIDAVRMSALVQ